MVSISIEADDECPCSSVSGNALDNCPFVVDTATQWANKSQRWDIEARDMILFRQPVDQEDGRLLSLKITILLRPGYQVLLWIRGGGRWGNKVIGPFNSCKYLLEWQASGRGSMFVSFFLQSTGGQGYEQSQVNLTVRQMGQDSLRQDIMYAIITNEAENKD